MDVVRIAARIPFVSSASAQARKLILALLALIALLLISGWHPYDRLTWLMEVLPVMLVLPILWFSYKHFPLTNLLYCGIFLHACVLILGGAYTYARVPLGFELQELFDLNRNPYDKIGHFMQGFVPALAARELFIRHRVINGKAWLAFLVVCVVMMVSAVYELVEWAAALAMGQGADEFLGTQGDMWDTQSDMFLALIGAISLLVLLSRWHDRQISKLT
jgi:putative membrane protein